MLTCHILCYLQHIFLYCSLYPESNEKIRKRTNEDYVKQEDVSLSITTKSPFIISSLLFENVCIDEDLMRVRTELKILLMSEFDSHQGIPVESNQPLGSPRPLINLTRPAVLRIYYGLSKSCTKSLNANRPTYGPISTSSSVGMDPHNFSTKAMSLTLFRIGEQVRCYLRRQCKGTVMKFLENEFNHCTVLIYSGENNNGSSNSSLAYHSDCTFDHNGNYIQGRNSQQENTCVAVLTMGDSRTLHFKKRIAINSKSGRKRWVQTEDQGLSFELKDNSVFMLDPRDEIPRVREGDDYVSQYIHGGIKISNKNDLSLALAFRVVCVDHEYDPVTSKLIAKQEDLRLSDNFSCEQNQRLRESLLMFRANELEHYSKRFHSFVTSKFKDWKW